MLPHTHNQRRYPSTLLLNSQPVSLSHHHSTNICTVLVGWHPVSLNISTRCHLHILSHHSDDTPSQDWSCDVHPKKMSKKYEHFLNKSANFVGTSSKFNTIPLTKFNIFSHWMAKSRFQCWILVRDQSWEKNSIKSSLNLIDNTFPLKWMAIQIMDDPD